MTVSVAGLASDISPRRRFMAGAQEYRQSAPFLGAQGGKMAFQGSRQSGQGWPPRGDGEDLRAQLPELPRISPRLWGYTLSGFLEISLSLARHTFHEFL
jgi:hypothetical protein